MNDKLRGQFNALMKILSYHPALDEEDHLAAAYYLALQTASRKPSRALPKWTPPKSPKNFNTTICRRGSR